MSLDRTDDAESGDVEQQVQPTAADATTPLLKPRNERPEEWRPPRGFFWIELGELTDDIA